MMDRRSIDDCVNPVLGNYAAHTRRIQEITRVEARSRVLMF